MEDKVAAHAIIKGRVQGVFFRMETKRTADRHGVLGWVKNNRDGSVEAKFFGDRKSVESVLEWCKKGPPLSKVKSVDIKWEKYEDEFISFKIV